VKRQDAIPTQACYGHRQVLAERSDGLDGGRWAGTLWGRRHRACDLPSGARSASLVVCRTKGGSVAWGSIAPYSGQRSEHVAALSHIALL
jgi:hypothetical protein